MKNATAVLFTALVLLSQPSFTQISFLGFEQEQCGVITDHGFTYQNISLMCGSHSSGYEIYLDGEMVYEKCIEFGGCTIKDFMFVNETTGFLVERNPNGHMVFKTTDSGSTWYAIGGGAPTLLGFYIVNEYTAYLVTTWHSPEGVYITRASDIESANHPDYNIDRDTIISDVIFGESFCDYDQLDFGVLNDQDTIMYTIEFMVEPVFIQTSNYEEITFYPNPAKDFVSFSNPVFKGETQYLILDLHGRTVQSGNIRDQRIDLRDLDPGIYLIEVTVGSKSYTGKIIKN